MYATLPVILASGNAVVVTTAGVPTDTARSRARRDRRQPRRSRDRPPSPAASRHRRSSPDSTVRAVTTPAIGDTTVVVCRNLAGGRQRLNLLWRHAEQLETRPRALDLGAMPHMLGVDPFQFLLTGRTDLHESLGASDLLLDGLELRSHREIACLQPPPGPDCRSRPAARSSRLDRRA